MFKQRGQTLVELMVAIGIAAVMLPALATALVAAREGRAQESDRLQAAALLNEANEAVRSVREKGWAQFATNGTFYPTISSNAWSLTSGTETSGIFTRSIVVSDARRNSSGAIVASGGTVDPSTKKVVTTVSWTSPISTSISNESYYQRYLNNATWAQTTQSDFNLGTLTNTVTSSTGGGQVEFSTIPGAVTWGSPSLLTSYDQPSSTTDATDVYIDSTTNRAYLATGTILRIINIANPASPTLLGSYTASGTINDVTVSGNYAYLATASNTGEMIVVNVTTPSAPTTGASMDLTGSNDGLGIYKDGNYIYLARAFSSTASQSEFMIIGVTTPTSPVVTNALDLTANANAVFVSGNYAYVATSVTSAELSIINVTNKSAPVSAGTYDASGTSIANELYVNGTTVYLAKANNTSGAELFVINAATPASPTLLGSYEAGANINAVWLTGTTAFIASAISSAQFRALNVTTPSSITVIGSLNMSATMNDVMQVGNYAYLVSPTDTAEMPIVQGTVTSSGYQTTGTFESSSFDAGQSSAYNYLTFTVTKPTNTNIQIQIAANSDNATWNYVGPDGTASTYFTAAASPAIGFANGRYFRYKATFTGPGTSTPVLSDVTVNYSP